MADAQAAYAKWKTDLLTSDGAGGFLRVRRPNSSGAEVNSTVSEGIAYGMLAAVYMNDQPTFDKLWQYSQLWLDGNGLMNWYINAAGTMPLGTGAATDGDEDMAFALLLADKRWGGSGSLSQSYLSYATHQIDLIWQFEVDHTRADVLTPGDGFAGGAIINISYFAPAFYRAFGRATGQDRELEPRRRIDVHRARPDVERGQRQRDEWPGPRVVDARRRAAGATGLAHPPPTRFVPNAVSLGAGLLLEQRAAGAQLPAKDQRLSIP